MQRIRHRASFLSAVVTVVSCAGAACASPVAEESVDATETSGAVEGDGDDDGQAEGEPDADGATEESESETSRPWLTDDPSRQGVRGGGWRCRPNAVVLADLTGMTTPMKYSVFRSGYVDTVHPWVNVYTDGTAVRNPATARAAVLQEESGMIVRVAQTLMVTCPVMGPRSAPFGSFQISAAPPPDDDWSHAGWRVRGTSAAYPESVTVLLDGEADQLSRVCISPVRIGQPEQDAILLVYRNGTPIQRPGSSESAFYGPGSCVDVFARQIAVGLAGVHPNTTELDVRGTFHYSPL